MSAKTARNACQPKRTVKAVTPVVSRGVEGRMTRGYQTRLADMALNLSPGGGPGSVVEWWARRYDIRQ